jgi:hypothetical protein
MPIEQIDMITRNILAQRGYENFFERARQAVATGGDPRTFMETLGRYVPVEGMGPFAGQATPGVFFGEGTIKGMFDVARLEGRAATFYGKPKGVDPFWYMSRLTTKEAGRLEGFLGGLGLHTGVSGITRYPGDVAMAHLRMAVPGLGEPAKLTLPLHPTRYRKPQAEYVMNKIFAGVPSEGGRMMNWGEYYVQQVKETLIPRLQEVGEGVTGRDLRRLIKTETMAFDKKMTQYMMWTPGIRHPGIDFMNRINERMVVAPGLSQAVVRNLDDKLRPDIDEEMGILFRKEGVGGQGLYPGVSGGQIVAGRMVGGADPRLMWAYGADFPWERRPLQFLREFAPTQRALQAMEDMPAAYGFARTRPFLATAARKELIAGGMVAPELLVGYAAKGSPAARALGAIGLGGEELLTRKEIMPMFETERITQLKLGLHEAVGQGAGRGTVEEWLRRAALGKVEPFPLKPGQQLGYELKTGKPLYAAEATGVRQELIAAELAMAGKGQEAARVWMREVHTAEDVVKLFGPLKVTTRARDAVYWEKHLKDAGLQMLRDLDAVTYTDELRKNRSLLKQQMASGLGMLAQRRLQRMDQLVMQESIARSTGAWTAAGNIRRRIEAYERAMSPGAMAEMTRFGAMTAEEIERMLPDELAILRRGRAWGLDVSLIGGGIPEAAKAGILPKGMLEEAAGIAGPRGLVHPSGWTIGAAAPSVGQYRHTMGGGLIEAEGVGRVVGAGGIKGTIEPRGVVGLLGHKWMVGQQNVAHMLAAENLRLMADYSTDVDEMMKASRTMLGQEIKGLERITAWAAEGKARDIPIRKAGYMLELGVPVEAFGGATAVYVPGEEALHRFAQFRGEGGELLRTELVKKYDRLARAATRVRNLGAETTAVEAMGDAAKELTKAVMQETGQAMYGRGGGRRVYGMTRGKRSASQFLLASTIDEAVSEATKGVMEVSRLAGEEMYAELERAAVTKADLEYVRAQRKTFLARKLVPGQTARHPFIGPYSIQPTYLRMAQEPLSATERFVRIPAQIDDVVDILGDASKALGKRITSNISPVVGMAADFDADFVMIGLIGDEKTAAATEKMLHGGRYMTEYRKFAAESSVLKELAKQQLGSRAATQLDDVKQMMMGSAKLRIAEAETGSISLAMSEAKLAMSYYKPDLAPRFNIIAEMMEQQIISGKKMVDVTGQNIARTVASAINEIGSVHEATKDLNKLVAETEAMFGPELARGVQMRHAKLGEWTLRTDPEQLWREAQGALRQGREKTGIITRYKQMARGHTHLADMNVYDMIQQIEGARAGKMDSLSLLAAGGPPTTPRGRMGHAVSNAIRGLNQARKELGAVSKTWYRPALAGLAATAAAAMLLGAPKAQPLDAPPRAARGDMRGLSDIDAQLSGRMLRGITPTERDLRPEALPVPGGPAGEPTAPGMSSPSTYMTNSPPRGFRVMARATAEDFTPDYDSVMQALRPAVGNANMRVNFRDNRAKMTSQSIADMMEEA